MPNKVIDGVKLIKHNASGINNPDDTSYPYKLEMSLSPPLFMDIAFIGIHGASEEILVRGKTEEALTELIDLNNFRTHPRLRQLTLTGPDGVILTIEQHR